MGSAQRPQQRREPLLRQLRANRGIEVALDHLQHRRQTQGPGPEGDSGKANRLASNPHQQARLIIRLPRGSGGSLRQLELAGQLELAAEDSLFMFLSPLRRGAMIAHDYGASLMAAATMRRRSRTSITQAAVTRARAHPKGCHQPVHIIASVPTASMQRLRLTAS